MPKRHGKHKCHRTRLTIGKIQPCCRWQKKSCMYKPTYTCTLPPGRSHRHAYLYSCPAIHFLDTSGQLRIMDATPTHPCSDLPTVSPHLPCSPVFRLAPSTAAARLSVLANRAAVSLPRATPAAPVSVAMSITVCSKQAQNPNSLRFPQASRLVHCKMPVCLYVADTDLSKLYLVLHIGDQPWPVHLQGGCCTAGGNRLVGT